MKVNWFTAQHFSFKFKQIGDDLSDDILCNLVKEELFNLLRLNLKSPLQDRALYLLF